jgi:hypothetical protein
MLAKAKLPQALRRMVFMPLLSHKANCQMRLVQFLNCQISRHFNGLDSLVQRRRKIQEIATPLLRLDDE